MQASPAGGIPPPPNSIFNEKTLMWVMESCPAKGVLSTGAGFVFGGLFGLFIAGTGPQPFEDPTKMKVRETIQAMGKTSFSYAKNFALVGGVYSVVECTIESYRAKHDLYNAVSAGCITGAGLAARAGPQAAAVGCAGFAAFSGAIDYYMEYSAHSRE